MKTFLFLISLFAVASSEDCGKSPLRSWTRIVGGVTTSIANHPWQISVADRLGHFCGGSIINREWVVSAAHCFESNNVNGIKIVVGTSRRNGSGGRTIKARKIIRHTRYNENRMTNDIALIRLASPLTWSSNVKPVCIPKKGTNFAGDCLITGWGSTREDGSMASSLQQVALPIVSPAVCKNAMSGYGAVGSGQICAGRSSGGKDSCQGDSGGPLVCRKNGAWHLGGIVSWGVGCARPRKYGVYTRTSQYDAWIKSQIAKNL